MPYAPTLEFYLGNISKFQHIFHLDISLSRSGIALIAIEGHFVVHIAPTAIKIQPKSGPTFDNDLMFQISAIMDPK